MADGLDKPHNLGALVVYKGRGRPSSFTWEVAEEICERLSVGESLNAIVKSAHMPDYNTVMRWVVTASEEKYPYLKEFRRKYARAREAQAEFHVDLVHQIAADGSNDYYTDADGKLRVDHENIARSKLRIDTIKWAASKMRPKKYADKIGVDDDPIDGGELHAPEDAALDVKERGRRIAFAMAQGIAATMREEA